MGSSKSIKKTTKKKHKFPRKEIIDHVEYEGDSIITLADNSSIDVEIINSFGAEVKAEYAKLVKKMREASDKLRVKSTIKVFLILEKN
jgi:hypothetical protein